MKSFITATALVAIANAITLRQTVVNTPRVYDLDSSDRQDLIDHGLEMNMDDEKVVKLQVGGNATTGYTWHVDTEGCANAVDIESEYHVIS